jgi:hypothetical protein
VELDLAYRDEILCLAQEQMSYARDPNTWINNHIKESNKFEITLW